MLSLASSATHRKMKNQKAPKPPVRRRPTLVCGPSRTKQAHASECDINAIVRRYDKDGVITHLRNDQATYADVSEMGSYRETIHTVREAKEDFLRLPHEIRAEFDNDPAAYLDFLATADSDAIEALEGLLKAPGPLTVTDVPPVTPNASETPSDA